MAPSQVSSSPSPPRRRLLVLHATGIHDAAERLDLEEVAPTRKAGAYAPETDWYKIKNRAYIQAEQRWALFLKRG